MQDICRQVARRASAIVALAVWSCAPAHAQDVVGEASSGGYWATVTPTGAVRSGDVLTVSLRFVAGEGLSAGPEDITFYETPDEGYELVYVIAGSQRYFPLRDADGTPLIPPSFEMRFRTGQGRAQWTGRFPAPPEEIDRVSVTFPLTSGLDGIPITDQ